MIPLSNDSLINTSFQQVSLDSCPNVRLNFLREIILANTLLPSKQTNVLLSGHSMGSVMLITDYTSLYRSLFDIIGLSIDTSTETPNLLQSIVLQKGILPGYHSFGLGTALNTILGVVNVKQDLDQIALSEKIGDRYGTLKGRIALAKDTIYASTGVVFGIFRPLAILSTVKEISYSGFQAPTLLGRVTYGFVFTGILFYVAFFLLSAAMQSLGIWKTNQFKQKFGKINDVQEQLAFLQKKLFVNPQKVLQKLQKKYANLFGKNIEENVKSILLKEGLHAGRESLKQVLCELHISSPCDEKVENILQTILSVKDEEVSSQLIHLGLQLCIQKTARKKYAKLQRVLGGKPLEELYKTAFSPLVDCIKNKEANALSQGQEIIAKVQKTITSNLRMQRALFGFSIFGVLTMGTAIVLTSGMGLIIASIAMVIFNVLSIVVDGYFFKLSCQGEAPVFYDKKVLIISSVLCLLSFASIVVLSTMGIVSMGLIPIGIMLILSLLWMGQNIISWRAINRIEKENAIKYPTLSELIEAVNLQQHLEILDQMVANLPEELQQKMKSELQKMSHKKIKKTPLQKIKQAALSVMKKTETIKKERLEILRDALQPYLIQSKA